MEFKIKIGLEIHFKINTEKKLFCLCKNSELGENTNSCFICLGFPGTLPILNEEVVNKAVDFSYYFSPNIEDRLVFDRKHYIYPDLPKGYQITQQFYPITQNGYISIFNKNINIERISIEEDAAKTIREDDYKKIDFNRCGTPLIEMCTSPDFSSIEQVLFFLKILRNIAEKKDIINPKRSDCIRCDVNISTNNNNKVEIKNVNSISTIKKALIYEIERQKNMIINKEHIKQETRTWKENKTVLMRDKETEQEYFFIPEYNIPNFKLPLNENKIDNFLSLEEKLKNSNDFKYVNSMNWKDYFLYKDYLDVERQNKWLKICLDINAFLLPIELKNEENIKKLIDVTYFLFFEQKNELSYQYIKDILFNLEIMKKDLKEIKKYVLQKDEKFDMKDVFLFIENISFFYKEEIKNYLQGNKKLFSFFVQKIKEKFDGLILNKDIINKLKVELDKKL